MKAKHASRIRRPVTRAGTESLRLGAGDDICTLRSAQEPSQVGAVFYGEVIARNAVV